MCCSRGHYSAEAGLTMWEGHHHLVMPDRIKTVCIDSRNGTSSVVYRNFLNNSQSHYYIEHYSVQGVADIVAVGIAEGHKLSKEWLEEVLHEWDKEHRIDVYLRSEVEYLLEPPEALDYASWLVRQAARELDDKLGETWRTRLINHNKLHPFQGVHI